MFRMEAISAKKQALHGDVFLVQPPSFKVFSCLLLLSVGISLFFLFKGTYARTEAVSGQLVPSAGLVKIVSPQHGRLEEIHAGTGAQVRAGQELAVIARVTRSSRDTSPEQLEFESLSEQLDEVHRQFQLVTRQYAYARARIQAEQGENSRVIDVIDSRLVLGTELLDSAHQGFIATSHLHHSGYASLEESETSRREWLKIRSQIRELEQQRVAERTRKQVLQIELQEIANEAEQRKSSLAAQRAVLRARHTELTRHNSYTVTAPFAGKIVSSENFTRGSTLQEGQALFTIVREDSHLRAELLVPSRSIGFVEPGQELRLLYDAFPYQHYGSHKAVVLEVSGTTISPGSTFLSRQLHEPVFRIMAGLESQVVKLPGRNYALQPGMTLQAYIILERRNFVEWVLRPLRGLQARS